MDLSFLIADNRDGHRLGQSGEDLGAIDANAAFGLVEPNVTSLLDSALERFFHADDRQDRLVILASPEPAPEGSRRKEPATRSFLASREIFHKAGRAQDAPHEWCCRARQWAVAGPGLAAEIEVVHKPKSAVSGRSGRLLARRFSATAAPNVTCAPASSRCGASRVRPA